MQYVILNNLQRLKMRENLKHSYDVAFLGKLKGKSNYTTLIIIKNKIFIDTAIFL